MAGGSAKKQAGIRIDLASVGGVVVGLGGILAGLVLDGGKVLELVQVNAALIVFGGTLGAVMLTMPTSALLGAMRRVGGVFFDRGHSPGTAIEAIIQYAAQARKEGIVSLEQQAAAAQDPFLRKALTLAVDGIDMDQIRSIMELEISLLEQDREAEAKVFEAAGGYSPTVGIIGAVLGLMQVMKNLANIDEVGRGIAAAFVATVYGVACANLFLLPAANKLRARLQADIRIQEVLLEGVMAIMEGLNPKLIRTKLEAYESRSTSSPKAKAKAKAQAAGAAVASEG